MPVSPPWSHLPPAHCRCRSVTAVVAPRPKRLRGSVLAENRSDVATSIDHPHDLNLLARDPVEQDGRVYDDFTNAGLKIIAIASHERRFSQAHRDGCHEHAYPRGRAKTAMRPIARSREDRFSDSGDQTTRKLPLIMSCVSAGDQVVDVELPAESSVERTDAFLELLPKRG